MAIPPPVEREALDISRRSIRLLLILKCSRDAGFNPVPGPAIHTIAYLADALSPVWGLPLLDSQILKTGVRPNFPALQRDLDALVGQGMVQVDRIELSRHASTSSAVAASFSSTKLADDALTNALGTDLVTHQLELVREVTFAASAMGADGLLDLGRVDASFADPLTDVGSMIDIAEPTGGLRSTAAVAQRFRDLAPHAHLTNAQLIHLYVRHLYSRLRVA